MKNKTKTTIFAFIVFMLLALTVYSALAEIEVNTYSTSKDFYVTSAFDTLSVCECSTKFDAITITNTGTYDAIFTIKTIEPNGKITFSENTLDIPLGQSKDVFIYYNAPCTSGSEDITFIIASNLGPQKEITKHITTQKCQNLQMWLVDYQKVNDTTKTIMPCSDAKYKVGIKNVGTYTETYTISNNYAQNTKYSANAVTLSPGQAFEFNATIKLDCSVYGDKDITFTANSVNNNLEAQISTKLSILRAYEYSVSVNNIADDSQSILSCNRVWSKQIPVTITNNANYENAYTFKTENLPNFASISGLTLDKNNQFSLKSKESKTFYIDVDTHSFRYEVKNYTFKLDFESYLGSIEKTKEVTLNLAPCYEHTITITNATEKSNPKELCSAETYIYTVDVQNNGKYTETIALLLDGTTEGMRLSKNSVTLAPGEKQSVRLVIYGPESNYLYNVRITAALRNGILEQDNLWVKTNDQYECHKIVIKNNKFRINYDPKLLTVLIENKGIVDGLYNLDWNENKTSLLELEESTIALKAGEKKALHFDVSSAGLKEGKYNGVLTVTESGSEQEYSKNIQVTLKDKTMFRKTFEYFIYGTSCRQFSLFEMIAIMLSIILIAFFIIKGPHYPYKFWNRVKAKSTILIILLCIFLGAVALTILFAGFPKTTAQVYNLNTSIKDLRFEWMENDKYVLNAAQFFEDPDNNTLKYSVSETEHIKAFVEGRFVTFYPDYAWYGNETVVITATDPFGANVDSPAMSLVVVHRPGILPLQWYNLYCWYVNLAIFIIILILVFIAFVVHQQKRTRKHKRQKKAKVVKYY